MINTEEREGIVLELVRRRLEVDLHSYIFICLFLWFEDFADFLTEKDLVARADVEFKGFGSFEDEDDCRAEIELAQHFTWIWMK